jgi:hypothetical protein
VQQCRRAHLPAGACRLAICRRVRDVELMQLLPLPAHNLGMPFVLCRHVTV